MLRSLFLCLLAGTFLPLQAQDPSLLASQEFAIPEVADEEVHKALDRFDRFNPALGSDSIRYCGEHPCTGAVEDHYPDGTLMHKGHYDRGRLIIYKNYHNNGTLEREFKSTDARRSQMTTYHSNGNLRSRTRYFNGIAIEYQDHYMNGQLRYAEEKHRSEPYYLRMDLFDANGDPISTLQLVDKKKVEFELKEYYAGGIVKTEGRARYNPLRMDSQRIGTWRTYSASGELLKEEEYIDGKVHR